MDGLEPPIRRYADASDGVRLHADKSHLRPPTRTRWVAGLNPAMTGL